MLNMTVIMVFDELGGKSILTCSKVSSITDLSLIIDESHKDTSTVIRTAVCAAVRSLLDVQKQIQQYLECT